MKAKLCLLISVFYLTACEGMLMTRSQVQEAENKKQMQDQVSTLQKTNADTGTRFADIEADLRDLHGRVDVVENRINQSAQEREQQRAGNDMASIDQARKVQVLQDEVGKLHDQIAILTAEINNLRANSADSGSDRSNKKDPFDISEELFAKKEWKKAIVSYQRFRDANPRHRKFAEATYKIGVCFQELGLKDEAKTFFDEVVAKFPNSNEAKRARTRLKSLKK
ncbi:MAG: hypothetical protein COT73_03260 [Bdellovibrio sp. CG10_big_fil_rev_8_21_14_0_10_47_8]|nr:MAG: hypothetical protein COT73_03260 [Bdellovibrio sp. CG10_big_fil_rev_8_21_14_0_10_47_8]